MKSRVSSVVDIVLDGTMRVRTRHSINANRAIARKRRQNSKQYNIKSSTARKLNINRTTICDTTTYVLGSGDTTILYMHGGTYVDAPTILHWKTLSHLSSNSNSTFYMPIYAKAPIGCADSVVDNMYDIYCQLCSQHGGNNMIVMGDSAGGGLALALCEMIAHRGGSQPRRIILLSPWLDVDMSNIDIEPYTKLDKLLMVDILRLYGNCYDNNSTTAWLARPILNITAQLAPIDIFVGSHELFLPDCLLAKQIADSVALKMNVYEFANMQHVFMLFPIPEASEAINMITQLIKEKL